MNTIIEKLKEMLVVPVVVLDDVKDAEKLADALVGGGLPCAEVTFRTAAAEESIRIMTEKYPDMLVGAGTVLTTEQVDKAVAAGAKFIVSPGFDAEIVDYCLDKNIPILPGVISPSEAAQAVKRGLSVVKFFPAEQYGGVTTIKALAAPYTMLGITVSFDGNFRSTLWSWEEARDFCTQCLPYIDVLIGIEPYHLYKDPSNHSLGDVKDGIPLHLSYEQEDEIFSNFAIQYPNIKYMARHVRYAHSGSENSLKAYLWYNGRTYESKMFTFTILDRVGGGDAFASGLIYAMMNNYEPMDIVNFAVASSAIKHTIRGDANITDDVESIKNLMNMNYDIKR